MSSSQKTNLSKGYVQTAHGQIHYRTAGQGPTIVMVHQAAQNSMEYAAVIPLLSHRFQVFALDLPGHGNSYVPDREYEVEDYCQSVIDFMELMSIDQSALVGIHGGASICIGVAAAKPDIANRLVLYGSSILSPEELEKFANMPMSRDLPLTADGDFLDKTWQVYQKMAAPGIPLETIFSPFLTGLDGRQKPYDAHHAVYRWDKRPHLVKIQCPTLLLKGTLDTFIGRQEEMANMIPDCVRGTLEDGGAFIGYEYPDRLAEIILGFFDE